MLRFFPLALGVLLFLGTSLTAAPLLVDFNDRTGAQPTQGGFLGITQLGATDIATDFGTLDLSIVGVAGIGLDDRDRGALNAGQPLSDLLRDFIYISESADGSSGDGTIDLIFSGLNAGTYKFIGYFHDRNVNHVAGDVSVSTDGGGTFTPTLDNVLFSAGTDPTEVGMGMFQFTATGSDDVHIRIVGQEGFYNLTSGAFTDQNTALIAGFELHQVPEPATLVVVALGAVLMCAARRTVA